MINDLVSINLISCERVLNEIDGVLTAVRIVEVFQFQLSDGVAVENQAIPVTVLVIAKFDFASIGKSRVVQLRITRPSGETAKVGEPHEIVLQTKNTDVPPGFNLIAGFGIIPKQMGLHFVGCLIDGDEVARTPIILQPLSGKPPG